MDRNTSTSNNNTTTGKTNSNNNNSNNSSGNTSNTRTNTNTETTPDTTSKRISAETPRNPAQQTPKTPTSARARSAPTSRGTTPSSVISPPLFNANREGTNNDKASTNNNNTPKDKQGKNNESDSTTPAYPESITLLNRSTSSAKIQLSDMQPVETKVVERIKNLEISIDQHRASRDQLEQRVKSLQQELNTAKEKHEVVIQVAQARMRELKGVMDQLQETSLANSGRLQELWELVRQLSEDLSGKEAQLVNLQGDLEELKQRRDEILQDREETEGEPLERVRREKAQLQLEYEEIQAMELSCAHIMEELTKNFSAEEIEIKEAKVRENEDRIAQLQGMIAENKSSTMIDERNADELILMFDKVYERRIRSHTQEFEDLEQQAVDLEIQGDQEANAALEEYLHLNQLSVEAEENASREEFNLLAEREKLAELESSLETLKLELSQRQETTTA